MKGPGLTTPPPNIHDGDQARLNAAYPNPARIIVAIRLARNVDTCAALLAGEPVDPANIDTTQLRWAKQRLLVRLDLHAIDLLTRTAA